MSKKPIEDQYVDWLSLRYYDKKVKDYIDSRCDNNAALEAVKVRIDELKDDIEDSENRVSEVIADLRSTEHSIHDQLHSHEERLNKLTLPDLSKYALKNEIPSVDGLASEDYVDEKVASIIIPEVPTKVSELENDAGYLTDVPEEYITDEDLESKGYLTEQSLEGLGFASEKFVEDQIASIPKVDLTEVETSIDTLSAITNKIKYEVLALDGMLVSYNDNEIRINTEGVEFYKQTSGEGSDPNAFYIGFKVYAPDTAVRFVRSFDGTPSGDDNTLEGNFDSDLGGVDSYGRKYYIGWLNAGHYDGSSWNKYGDLATSEKCLGYYITLKWFEDTGKVVGIDNIRVVFTNNEFFYSDVSDAVARRLADKASVTEIQTIVNDKIDEAIASGAIDSSIDYGEF